MTLHSGQTQCACAIQPGLLPANYREIRKPISKSHKVKSLLEREALNVEYLEKSSSYLFTSDFMASYFVFVNVFLVIVFFRPSLHERLELMQIFIICSVDCSQTFLFVK